MADISKVKIGTGEAVNLKDAKGRSDLTTLIGTGHTAGTAVLGAAAWEKVASAIDKEGLVSAAIAKAYVDAQVGAIHKFDVVVADELPTASADTMYKLYLIPKSGSKTGNVKEEWITVRSGAEGSYTYAWEKVGDTEVDLTGYLRPIDVENWKVAGIKFGTDHDVTVAELEDSTALDLKALAHKANATGTVEGQTISGVKATGTLSASLTGALGAETTNVALTKDPYTPSGSVTGSVVAKGNVSVTIKDASATTSAALDTKDYMPEGTVSGTVSVPNGASLTASDSGVQITGSVSAPAINITPATQTVLGSVKSAGTVASFTEGAFSPATLGNPTLGSFATEGISASVDDETLVFTAVTTSNAVIAQGSFFGGSKVADTFNGGAMPEFNNASVLKEGTSAALASNPVFTGSKFAISLTNTDRDIDATFTGSKVEDAIVTGVKYYKQEINTATFTGSAADIAATFSGNEVEDLRITGATYSKTTIGTLGASASLPSGGLSVGDIVVASKDVTVS